MLKNISTVLLTFLFLASFQVMTASEKQEKITAPAGLSLPVAFRALYDHVEPLGMGHLDPQAGQSLGNNQHTMQVLLSKCAGLKCDYVCGKPIKTYFTDYPNLDVTQYNKQHGKGAAQAILEKAARTNKFDTSHYSKDVCSYFQGTTFKDAEDRGVLQAFTRCQNLKDVEQKVAAYKTKKASFLDTALTYCVASYTLRQGQVNRIPHDYKPCEEALRHIRNMQKQDWFSDGWIENFSVCKKVHPSIPIKAQCMDLDRASLESSAQLIEFAMEKK